MFSFMNPGKSKPAKKGLKIIIVGCGKVGTTLVEQLSKEDMTLSLLTRMRKSTGNREYIRHYGYRREWCQLQRADGCRN